MELYLKLAAEAKVAGWDLVGGLVERFYDTRDVGYT